MTYKMSASPSSPADVEPPSPAASFAALVEEWVRWAEAYGAELEKELQDAQKRQHSGLR
ncbi:hypothetical protein [Streptomyces sp. NPDC054842]